MKHRNLKVRKVLKALKEYGCIEIRNTSHGIILENTRNKKSTNLPTHQDILPIWIYNNILRQLDIKKEDIGGYL